MSKTSFYDIWKRDIGVQDFGVGETDNPPPTFFKRNTTGKVFATLNWDRMGRSINLDDYTPFNKDEVHYSPKTREWVLGSIRLSEATYQTLKGNLRGYWTYVEVKPITEEAQTSDPEWGPVTP